MSKGIPFRAPFELLEEEEGRTPPAADAPDQEVVEYYQGAVQSIVGSLVKSLSVRVDREDLVAYGNLGLLQAWRRYDKRATNAFLTFAYYRIRGAILDGCRKEGWVSRTRIQQLTQSVALNDYLEDYHESEHSHAPEPTSLSESVDRVSDMVGNALMIMFVQEADLEHIDVYTPPRQDKVAERKEKNEKLSEAIGQLDPEERILIKRHHYYGDSITDIARDLNKSKSWCSRMHARAIDRLRQILTDELELEPVMAPP